jgi:hypothetical protein
MNASLSERREAWNQKEAVRRELFWNKATGNAGAIEAHLSEGRILLMAESIMEHGHIVYDRPELVAGKVNWSEVDAAHALAGK